MQISSLLRSRPFLIYSFLFLLLGAITVALWPTPIPFDEKEFYATTLPRISKNAPFKTRVFHVLEQFLPRRARKWTFMPTTSNTAACSVSGLLNQCMEVSGTRYLIHKELAASLVYFRHTNALSGPQWVAAFENALQTGTPEWYDWKLKKTRNESLVLIRFTNLNTVLVIPKDKAAQFQPGK
jgi:hypothetical protein